MIRIAAFLGLVWLGGCNASEVDNAAKAKSYALDMQSRATLMRARTGITDFGTRMMPSHDGMAFVKLSAGEIAPLYSVPAGGAGDHVPPAFKVCREADGAVDVEIWVYTEGTAVGPQHPSIQKLGLKPGGCMFVGAPFVEARTVGYSSEDAEKTSAFLKVRNDYLKADPRSPAFSAGLQQVTELGNALPSSILTFEIE